MSKITVEWANEQKTVLLVTYHNENWLWSDVAEALQIEFAMIDSVEHVVNMIIDLRGSRVLPKGGSPFRVIQQSREARHPRQGVFAIVGLRGAIAKLADLLKRMPGPNPREVYIVESVEDALALLENRSK